MRERRGNVWYEDRLVGRLREGEDRALRFAYAAEWLDGGGFPVSIHLPLANGEREIEAHGFFEGLLPEGRVRVRICRQAGIDPKDDVGLLLAIGEDCAGALSILPPDKTPEDDSGTPRQLTNEEFAELVRTTGETAQNISQGQQRFSLAGVQEKQALIHENGCYALPDRSHPSSHIIKFETVPRVCIAEFTTHDMARRAGLPVVDTDFLVCASDDAGDDTRTPYLRIERFDRRRDESGRLRRLHQEDIIQALGEFSALKYQRDGGPGLGDVAKLLREHTANPAASLARLRDWQIFNYLAGNWDGHGKNLALSYEMGEAVPSLAPFYDLVAIEFLNLVRPHSCAREMAFLVGDNDVPEKVTRADWEAFSRDLGMPPKRTLARLEELATALPAIARETRQQFAAQQGDEPIYDQLEESVRRRCHWTLQSVFAGS